MKGPTGVLAFSLGGKEWMGAFHFVAAMLAALGIATISMTLLCLTRERIKTALPRALLIMSLGAVVFLSSQFAQMKLF